MGTLPYEVREIREGCRVLRHDEIVYRDGAEGYLYRVVAGATDLGSLSDELASQASTWAQHYHLSTARANLLRSLEWDASLRVLEVGAGCGALTRYLGETCGQVDALEPVFDRARVARARTRDLANVNVLVGMVEDVPEDELYDVVVVVGVLEYIGLGTRENETYEKYLGTITGHLRPGGTLVLAIENRLGVKYLAGAPEDHSQLPYDSIEGYPHGGLARTFSRRELEDLLVGTGLRPNVLSVFPDYKITRVVFSDELLEVEPSLAWHIPSFPSPDWLVSREKAADEGLLWKSLASSGVGSVFANSFLVCASRGAAERDLWPADQLATFYDLERKTEFATQTRIVRTPRRLEFRRRRLRDGLGPPTAGRLSHHVQDTSLMPGVSLLDLLAIADDGRFRQLLDQFVGFLDRTRKEGSQSIDLVPHNVLVAGQEEMVAIDDEWSDASFSRSDVLARAALVCGPMLATRAPPERWSGDTVRDVVIEFGHALGLRDDVWLEDAIAREARMQDKIRLPIRLTPDPLETVVGSESHIRRLLAEPLANLPLGERVHDQLLGLRRSLAERDHEIATRDEMIRARDETIAARDETIAALDEAIIARDEVIRDQGDSVNELLRSTSWRVTAPLRKVGALVHRLRRKA